MCLVIEDLGSAPSKGVQTLSESSKYSKVKYKAVPPLTITLIANYLLTTLRQLIPSKPLSFCDPS